MQNQQGQQQQPPKKQLFRSSANKVFAGVCGGLGAYFDVDPIVLRIAWVALTIVSFGAGILAYLLFWLIMPKAVDAAAFAREA
ncbi:MAG: PspC domain-containing protein [Clostridiales Family XIII bacterium]|jgi:phage shock protein C|nr:PspC domain-containing protein [Clostridiales Family XIII bacterium]